MNKTAKLSLVEARAIAYVTEKSTGKTTLPSALAFSRRDVGRFLRQPALSDEIAEMFIASIDQDISGAKNKYRWILLRDKVLFIAGRCMHLTLPQWLALKVSQFENKRLRNFSFWTLPNSASDASTMLTWYIKVVRPQLAQDPMTDAVFISSKGRGLGESAVGMRFARAAQSADLVKVISGWSTWIK